MAYLIVKKIFFLPINNYIYDIKLKIFTKSKYLGQTVNK